MNAYWKIGLCLVLAITCFIGGWTVNGWRKDAEIKEMKFEQEVMLAERLEAAAKEKAGLQEEMNGLAVQIDSAKKNAAATTEKLKKELKNATPYPVGCRLDAGRMRILEDAIASANSFAGSR